jgi:hypothetical protein
VNDGRTVKDCRKGGSSKGRTIETVNGEAAIGFTGCQRLYTVNGDPTHSIARHVL